MNKILVIDDDQDLLSVLEGWFTNEGFETRVLAQINEVFDVIE